jgi:hypothetical protein
VEIVDCRRSWRDIFWWKTGHRRKTKKQEEEPFYEEKLWEVFLWLHFLPSGAPCSGPQRSRARRCSGAAERTLDGEDRCESMGAGGKDLVLKDARR